MNSDDYLDKLQEATAAAIAGGVSSRDILSAMWTLVAGTYVVNGMSQEEFVSTARKCISSASALRDELGGSCEVPGTVYVRPKRQGVN